MNFGIEQVFGSEIGLLNVIRIWLSYIKYMLTRLE
jgi:hypothetical protein